ncbi:tetratricopeptide repeat protein [Cellulosimicrobium marinum]|uniref:tetratricopeptide repeat protein n=1 Tax=Cellulosimicrobium marinum TaxID=1638992 RepID=UPI001E338578|nr:tetratricopeptide repeat protein [Cellulosimicrobium marinum]MCB7137720.1 tetratricopeptide repeat protein [Cellulosimicrobium marinum]
MSDDDAPASGRRGRRPWKPFVGALLVTALLALYVWQVAGRALALVRTGEPVAIAIGAAVLILPLLVIGLVAREFRLAATVQRMADELARDGRLPVDDLPRSPGGRIDRAAADAAFGPYREAVEADPQSWEAWYHLAFAYDASGDRRRAREALRTAAARYRAGR